MNYDRLVDDWHQLKRRIRRQWGRVTEADLARFGGELKELAAILERRYHFDRRKARDDVHVFAKDLTAAKDFATGISEAVAQAGDMAYAAWQRNRNRVRDVVADGRDRFKDLLDSGRERVSKYAQSADDLVRSRPVASIAAAVGAGAVVAYLLWRRRSN